MEWWCKIMWLRVCMFKRLEIESVVCVFLWELGSPLEPECLGWNLGLSIFQLCETKSDSQISSNNIILLRTVKHGNLKKLKISLYYCHEARLKTFEEIGKQVGGTCWALLGNIKWTLPFQVTFFLERRLFLLSGTSGLTIVWQEKLGLLSCLQVSNTIACVYYRPRKEKFK